MRDQPAMNEEIIEEFNEKFKSEELEFQEGKLEKAGEALSRKREK